MQKCRKKLLKILLTFHNVIYKIPKKKNNPLCVCKANTEAPCCISKTRQNHQTFCFLTMTEVQILSYNHNASSFIWLGTATFHKTVQNMMCGARRSVTAPIPSPSLQPAARTVVALGLPSKSHKLGPAPLMAGLWGVVVICRRPLGVSCPWSSPAYVVCALWLFFFFSRKNILLCGF